MALGVVSITILTRYLGPEAYGRYSLALAFVVAFGAAADAGLFAILVREIARAPERGAELVGNALTLRALLWVAVSALAALVGWLLPYPPQVQWGIVLAALPFGLGLASAGLRAPLQAELRMGGAAAAEVAGRAAALAGAGLVAALDLGFYAALVAVAAGAAVTLGLTAVVARRRIALRPRADRRVWRALLVASLPLGLALALNEIYFRADQVILSLSRPDAEVGWYGLAFRVVELSATFAGALLISAFPVLAVYVASDDPRLRAAVQAAFDVLVAAGAPLALGGLVLAGDVVQAVGGERFAGAADALRILLFAAALAFVNGLFGHALIARDRQRDTLWLNVAALTLNLGLNVALVPAYGLEAAAATAVASELAILAGSWWLVRRHLGVWPGGNLLWRAVAAAAVMAGMLWVARAAPLAVLLVLGGVVYAGVLVALGGVRRWRFSALSR